MASTISLSVGTIDIEWGKNDSFQNHAHLFQSGDETEGPYYYGAEDGRPIVEVKRCLARSLRRVVPRLELLGYTLGSCGDRFARWFDFDLFTTTPSLEGFKQALRSLQWSTLDDVVAFEEAIRQAYVLAPLSGLPPTEDSRYIASGKTLDPYLVLRLLAEMPEYEDLTVRWNFADVLDGGYAREASFVPGMPIERWMVVTEGTSDAFVLQQSLLVTHPDTADFFDFIDMSTGNPFPGVGSILAFCRGLSRIGYTGRMLVVLDNDAAGRQVLDEIRGLKLPTTFVATCLPDLGELGTFKTLGPTGVHIEDINRRASAIECFLDFNTVPLEPTVRWTTFIHKASTYQGELIAKEKYVSAFKDRFGKDDSYDGSKLTLLWKHLVALCSAALVPGSLCSANSGDPAPFGFATPDVISNR